MTEKNKHIRCGVSRFNTLTTVIVLAFVVLLLPGFAFAQVVNTEEITTTGDGAHGINAIGAITNGTDGSITTTGIGAHGIRSTGGNATVRNDGTIMTDGAFVSSGIRSEGDNAAITNNGTITTNTASGHGIVSSGDNATVTNNGTIMTGLDTGDGINANGINATVINNGTIITKDLRSHGISVTREDAKVTLGESGTISTTGDISYGIEVTGDAATIDSHGRITTIGDEAHGIWSPEIRPGTIDSNGPDGVVITDVEITLGESGTISTTGRGSHGIVSGSRNGIINLNGKISATGEGSYVIRGSDEENQTLILGAQAIIDGYSDLGESEGDNDIFDIVAKTQGRGPSRTFAIRGVDTVRSGRVPVLYNSNAVAVVDPTAQSATRITLGAMTGQIRRQVFQRLDSSRLPRGTATRQGVWGGLFGTVSERDDDGSALAWDHRLYGASGGVDVRLDNGRRAGLFAGVGQDLIRTQVTSVRDSATHGFVGAYGQQSVGEFNLDGAVIFGYAHHDSARTVQDTARGQEVANGKYDNFYVSPSLSLKWFKELGNGMEFRPRAQIAYTYGHFGSHTESGTTHSNISFSGRSVNIIDGRMELALARTFDDDQGEVEVRGGATFTHFGRDSVRARLGGGPSVSYRISGEDTIPGGFGGIRMRYQITDVIAMNGDLEYARRSGNAQAIGGHMWLDMRF